MSLDYELYLGEEIPFSNLLQDDGLVIEDEGSNIIRGTVCNRTIGVVYVSNVKPNQFELEELELIPRSKVLFTLAEKDAAHRSKAALIDLIAKVISGVDEALFYFSNELLLLKKKGGEVRIYEDNTGWWRHHLHQLKMPYHRE